MDEDGDTVQMLCAKKVQHVTVQLPPLCTLSVVWLNSLLLPPTPPQDSNSVVELQKACPPCPVEMHDPGFEPDWAVVNSVRRKRTAGDGV